MKLADSSSPGFPIHGKILFCTDGNPVALLVSNKAGRRKQKAMQFDQAESALAWCRQNSAVFVLLPPSLDRN